MEKELEKISVAATKLKALCGIIIEPVEKPELQTIMYILEDYAQEIKDIINDIEINNIC